MWKWKWKLNNPKPLDAAKAVLRGKFIVINAYLRKHKKISNEQRKIEKKGWAKPEVGKRKETIKIKTEISETKSKGKTIEKMTGTKSWFFKKILKKEMTPQEKERAQINKIRKEKGEVRLTPQKYKGSQGIWANVRSKIDNLEKRDYSFLKKKFLGTIS